MTIAAEPSTSSEPVDEASADVTYPVLVEYTQGTWAIDPWHSIAIVNVGHMTIGRVFGRFNHIKGTITLGEDIASSSVTATIDATSMDSGDIGRDAHVRDVDMLDVKEHPVMSFRSTAVRSDGELHYIDGDLTIRDVTRPVTLEMTVNGFIQEDEGTPIRVGFSAVAEIERSDFKLGTIFPTKLISDEVFIQLEIEATLDGAA